MKTFVLSEDQEMLRELACSLSEAEIAPRSEAVDHTPLVPSDGVRILAEAGLISCMVPERFGGAELDYWSQTCVIEETAKSCASTAWAVANIAEVAECLLRCGTEAQKSSWLPELASGTLAAVAGSDAAPGFPWSISLTAQKTASGYLLNGRKKYVPLGGGCSWYLVAAEQGQEIQWFLVRGDEKGLSVQENSPQLGMKGCGLHDLVFENCLLPADRLLPGQVGEILDAAQALHMAAIASGIAQGALKEAIQYVNQRIQFGKTIAQFENTQQVLAELLAKAQSIRALVWDAAMVKDDGSDYSYVANLAKLAASDAAAVITRKCVQFMGGYGYSREYPVERKMRDAKMTMLLGGANIALKEQVALNAVVQA